ncbi:FAD dependent oxidoreductase [Rhodospirillum rubrum F11]|uniref:FAD dependent oxidoreductase n=2 Tax=Rhodospirillum rubrum TaxID=1085 RepID=Q2RSN1_RHORT|nr:FAD-binding oxidoreductase [Rhodospirillum rubrum]ABC22864.1 FAD dependent oxidoreductase [Rhodospirillum rubrum ATCC 11170]AEO48587.1 FAD dependent oxidoreductase [Rhodospirillum rubrum F11]MBK5954471.1 FAD-binding oxidoreductase [Rhodospirillum rubrum]QXG78852.1 FAD-binding oxidoreductase [Rhodospirillum rubrum]HCF17555.1 FAD-binding oxidoreductase [Rhodospirillum rubrum]
MPSPADAAPPLPTLVVGAGIIGVCCALALQERGLSVTLIDAKEPGQEASFGNAGCLAASEILPMAAPGLAWKVPRWLLDPLGPLALRPGHLPALIPWLLRFLRAGTPQGVIAATAALAPLADLSWRLWPELARAHGLAGDIHAQGTLTLYETDAAFQADAAARRVQAEHGIVSEILTPGALAEREPDLAPIFRHGVFHPRYAHVSDPAHITAKLAERAVARGAVLVRGRVLGIERGAGRARLRLEGGASLEGARVVIAAGAWSGALCRALGHRVLLESERGYNTTLPDPGVRIGCPISSAEGKFMLSPLDIGLRIGGAAEFAGLTAPANYRRCDALLTVAKRFLPGLRDAGGSRWMGQRPSTPDSLPVIDALPGDGAGVLLAFGHGHLGLTNAPGTAAMIAALACGETAPIDAGAFSLSRFA